MDVLNAIVLLANYVIVPALAYGAQLALGALGLTLLFSVLRFSNFAYGDLMAFGSMATVLATWWLQAHGIGIYPLPTALLALPVGVLAAIAITLLIDRFVYRFYRRRGAPSIVLVIASIGVMYLLNAVIRIVVGPDDRRFADGVGFVVSARDFKTATGLDEGLSIRLPIALTLVAVVAIAVWLYWFLFKTRTGKSMRAYSDNSDLALLSGIDPERVVTITWVISAALATTAGVLYGLDKSFQPFTYFQLLLPIFAATILGGIGQPFGAIAGGFTIAFSEIVTTYAYKRFFEYLGWHSGDLMQPVPTEYKYAISFGILVLVLLFRPTGIFKGKLT